MLVEGESPDTLMAQITRIVDCTTAEAKQLANRDELPRHRVPFGHVREDNIQHPVDLLFDERAGRG